MTSEQGPTIGVAGRQEYPRPPIIEALCQFTFASPISWSPILPGMLFERIRSSYPADPEVQQQVQANVQFPNDAAGGAQFHVGQGEQRMIYRSADLNRLAVVSPSSISANSLAPYEGWPSLSNRFREVLRRTQEFFRGASVGSVSVRYINRVFLPLSGAEPFNAYFNIPYRPVGGVGGVTDGLLQRVESTLSDGVTRGILTFSSVDLIEGEVDGKAFVLDLEFVRPLVPPGDFESAMLIAEELKILENSEFEACITDRARELFR
jgi:uncharacterized protein (TIGR04255 family)